MSRTVIISKTAEKKLEKLFEFLLEKWSQKVKSDFIKKLDKNINLIKNNPEGFPESENKVGLHKCVITKQTTLFYRYTFEKITIVTVFDTRQNPNKLKKEI
ncbi:type II toxin-antitoxin system RelE/ParE family toxin [Lacinutrix sp.]|uniref:type II toxin-antitoxin system RelE/ParE family toxin n=1 Tax=Lacinutrix sp. TaxID=1937692 RepID=UPI0025B8E70B|nr:type II toxin-antitoxin system RelE/ParE family toxin [Lacinutrix sp.]